MHTTQQYARGGWLWEDGIELLVVTGHSCCSTSTTTRLAFALAGGASAATYC